MEIALLPNDSVRIKGKNSSFLINSSQASNNPNALILLKLDDGLEAVSDGVLVVDGPGDFEVAGVKITTYRSNEDLVHVMLIDSIEIMLGRIEAIERLQSKVGDSHIVLFLSENSANPSSATSVATNVIMFFGDTAKETAGKIAKDSLQEMSKYSVTLDKLPTEIQTILLT